MAARSEPKPEWQPDGQRLAAALKRAGWTQQQLATATSARKETISRIIAGKQAFTYEFRKQVCAALGCTLADLDGSGAENPESTSTRPDNRTERSDADIDGMVRDMYASLDHIDINAPDYSDYARKAKRLLDAMHDMLDKIGRFKISNRNLLADTLAGCFSAKLFCVCVKTMRDLPMMGDVIDLIHAITNHVDKVPLA